MRPWFRRPPAAVGNYELLSRNCCHLCDEMAELLEEVLPRFELTWSRVEIDTRPELVERFSDVVPVLLRDGKAVAKTRVDRRQLERIIHRRRSR